MRPRTPWKTILLDVHTGKSQMAVTNDAGEVLLEMQVRTREKDLRRAVEAIPGRKRVIFEEGPLSALVHDALKDVVDEIISSDPSRNEMIATAETSTDELDARRLGVLYRAGGIFPVAIAEEPYRTLRSVLNHDLGLLDALLGIRNRLKGLARRYGIPTAGQSIYRREGRKKVIAQLPNVHLRWQMRSQYEVLDELRAQRVAAHRQLTRIARKIPVVRLLRGIPGVGLLVGATIVAWVMDPNRFRSRSAISAYGGLGLGQGYTAWQQVSPTRASLRGNRKLKRVLFLAAKAAVRGTNGLAERYWARIELGWEDDAATRDIARKILVVACAMIRTGRSYDDSLVKKPTTPRQPAKRRKPRARKSS